MGDGEPRVLGRCPHRGVQDGAPHPAVPDAAPLYVMSKDDGAWRIAAAQSTAVFDDPAVQHRRAG